MNNTGRNSGPDHARDTGAWPTLPLWNALARHGADMSQVPRPPQIQPGHDGPDVTVPIPVDPAAADANSTHLWPVANAGPRRPSPRPAVPPAAAPVVPDWRHRLGQTVRRMPWQAHLLAAFLLACAGVVLAVLIGALS